MTARTDWQGVHGANYIPSYSRSPEETWERFDPEIVDRELGFAQGLGLNTVRVTLSSRVYESDPAMMSNRFEEFLSLCDRHELRVIPVVFEGCGVEERDLRENGESDPHFRRWTVNPDHEYMGPEYWGKLETYVNDIVGAHLKDSRVLAWDVINEPWFQKMNDPKKKSTIDQFVDHFCRHVTQLNSEAPTTVGVQFFDRVEMVDDLVGLITFHSYLDGPGDDPGELAALLEKANEYARLKGKPMLMTEWGGPTWRTQVAAGWTITEADQREFFEKVLPQVMEMKIGWCIFDLITGYGPFGHISLLRTNGDKRPAAEVIEKYLKGTQAG